mgnify:FL=1
MLFKKKILCLIPARGGSKGIKLKNLKKIGNKSLVSHTITFAKNLKFLDDIIVSSDNKKILNIGKKLGVSLHLRSKKLSGDYVSDISLILDVIKNKKYVSFDYLLYLQPTSPFRFKKDFLKALKKLIKQKADAIWSVTNISNKNHPLKVLKENKKKYLQTYLNSGKKIVARQELDEIFIRNGIFYFFSIKKLKLKKTIYLKKSIPYQIFYEYFNIDTPNDLKLAKKLYKKTQGN